VRSTCYDLLANRRCYSRLDLRDRSACDARHHDLESLLACGLGDSLDESTIRREPSHSLY
jgi:hypothetical protein